MIWQPSFSDTNTSHSEIFIITILVILVLIVVLSIYWFDLRGKEVLIEEKLLFFKRKAFLNSGEMKIINLEQIDRVESRKQVTPMFTGKVMIMITKFWFVFLHKDGRKEEVSIDGWDKKTLKELILYIKKKFPKIKWNTHIYQDNPEKISGLDEYLKKKDAS